MQRQEQEHRKEQGEHMKKGQLVTLKKWYMPKRVYGHYEGLTSETWGGKRMHIVKGGFGLVQTYLSELKSVRLSRTQNKRMK